MRKRRSGPSQAAAARKRLVLDKARQALGQTGGGSSSEQLLGAGNAVPARERFGTLDLAGYRIDLRLEHDCEFADGR